MRRRGWDGSAGLGAGRGAIGAEPLSGGCGAGAAGDEPAAAPGRGGSAARRRTVCERAEWDRAGMAAEPSSRRAMHRLALGCTARDLRVEVSDVDNPYFPMAVSQVLAGIATSNDAGDQITLESCQFTNSSSCVVIAPFAIPANTLTSFLVTNDSPDAIRVRFSGLCQ